MNLIIGKNIKLELLNESHTQELFDLTDQNREYLRKWLPWVDSTKTVEDTRAFVEISKKSYEDKKGFNSIIKYNEYIAGIIGLVNINYINRKTEIGYWLGSEYQGKGIITKACHSLVDYCFNELDLNRIIIRCALGNKASQGIPERLNFKKEGIHRQDGFLNGEFVDHIQYAMLKVEWKK